MRRNGGPHKRTAGMVLLGHCKPLQGGEEREKDFYSECEWRFIPWVDEENKYGFFLTEAEFNDRERWQEANKERRNHMLPFGPDDIRYLLAKSREDVTQLLTFLDSLSLEHHSWADCPTVEREMLKTRIIALDDLSFDL